MPPMSGADEARVRWEMRYRAEAERPVGEPSAWVMRHALALPESATILDLAAGRGRPAVPLAPAGRVVAAVDVVEVAVAAARGRPPGTPAAVVGDVGGLRVRERSVDAVLSVTYLARNPFPQLGRLLRPGGRVIIETFTIAQRTLGRGPRNPDYMLEPGELPTLVEPLEVIESAEGLVRDDAGERYVAGVVAVRPLGAA